MANSVKLYKKLHKWPGLIMAFILLYYGVTGIFMNHRAFFSRLDVNRNALPKAYHFHNWNNGALKGNLTINKDSILVYGQIGIWVTDKDFKSYSPFMKGFPKGSDNYKIFDLHRSADGNLYAATQFGLFAYNSATEGWEKFDLDVDIKRFVAIESVQDTLYVLNRSFLFKGQSNGVQTTFKQTALPAPEGHKPEVLLFETLWQIHSGEIFGIPGKLFVDALGLITVFLSVTGIFYFFFPGWMKRRRKRKAQITRMAKVNKWSLKWHNFTGGWTFAALIILFFTGMFLRPPLLIAIGYAKVAPLKFSHLDQPNPWYDKLRDLQYDKQQNQFMLATSEGLFRMDGKTLSLAKYNIQPPVSVMGVNVLQPYKDGAWLVGSFSGLFLWHPSNPEIYNFAQGKVHVGQATGRPVGDYKITGVITDTEGTRYMVDYDKGMLPLYHSNSFPSMPTSMVNASKMSLWNVSLEIHTGRFFNFLMGMFYILIVPLTGLAGITVLVSGYVLWKKKYKKHKK